MMMTMKQMAAQNPLRRSEKLCDLWIQGHTYHGIVGVFACLPVCCHVCLYASNEALCVKYHRQWDEEGTQQKTCQQIYYNPFLFKL